MSSKTLISIVGPTAIGKTALSIEIAQHFQAPILSCDSRQFYKEIAIGTAVPSEEELAQAPHYFIQNRSIFENYNVGQFERDALAQLEQLFLKKEVVVLVGGSGLYVDALLKGLDHFPEIDPKIRQQLNQELAEEGLSVLQNRLKELDAETYEKTTLHNPHRVIRALEVCIGSGKPYSSFKNKPKAIRNFETLRIGLTAERNLIYDRINRRVDRMMENGLLEEARRVHPHKDLNALQTVGYRELFAYFEEKCELEAAVAEIKKNTRRFAKRQMTWFKKDADTTWFDHKTALKTIVEHLEKSI